MTTPSQPGKWDFGLDAEQEARAARLHSECLVFDGMNQHPGGANIFADLPPDAQSRLEGASGFDGLGRAIYLPYELAAEGKSDAIRRWWFETGVDVGTVGILTHPDMINTAFAQKPVTLLQQLDWIEPVTTAAQIRENKRRGVISMWGYEQPNLGIPNRISAVEDAYRRGLRTLMLTYNRLDFVGAGCTERADPGLSMYGLDVVKTCNEMGIIVDTSHCGHQTTLDACRFSRAPVLANHSAARGVFDHARGKSDEELDAIAKTGGVIGVLAAPFLLSGDDTPSIEHMLDHIDYLTRRVGWRHVGLGTDWPMQAPIEVLKQTLAALTSELGFRAEDKISVDPLLAGFHDGRDFPNITRGLVARGYTDEEIGGILGENYMRVVEQVCG